jgi:hypothetical protein
MAGAIWTALAPDPTTATRLPDWVRCYKFLFLRRQIKK